MKLRPYQSECLKAIESAGPGRWLVQLFTGAGKTVIFANLPRPGRTLVLSHRQELVRQPLKYYDCATSVEMGDEHAGDTPVVSASVQTMARRANHFAPDAFDTIVVDEAHHAASESYRRILDHFHPRRVLGFTATPNRADGLGLDRVFDDIVFRRDLRWGVEHHWLSPIDCRRAIIGYDLRGVATRLGDYSQDELARAVNVDSCNQAVAEVVSKAEGPVLVFAVDVAHAEALAEACGGVAVSGATPRQERADVLERFAAGDIRVLVNCALFTEGTDIPSVRTVVIARPTKSQALYVQMVGRGTRLAPGKERMTLVDCVGVTRMPICTAPSLLGYDLDVVPDRLLPTIEGDLLADIPEVLKHAEDTPASWVMNTKAVDLFARRTGYRLHDLNWIHHADGSLTLGIPGAGIRVSAPDSLGRAEFHTSGGWVRTMSAQDCYDLALKVMRDRFYDKRPLWNLTSAKRWGRAEATDGQRRTVRFMAHRAGVDVSDIMGGLTKLQASHVIEQLKDRRK